MPRSQPLSLLLFMLAACGPGDQGSTGSTTDTTTATTTATTSPTTAPTSGSADTSSTDATSTGPATTDATTTTSTATATTSSDTTGAPPVCGEQSCPAGEVCVLPCCGGPAPPCTEPDGGVCPGGQDPVPSEQCQFTPCAGPLCCLPVACTPDPPFCVAPALLTCNGNSCSIDSCFGNLSNDRLECQCA